MKNLKLLSKIALSFQNLNKFEQEMNERLEEIGKSIDISRIYILFNDTEELMSNKFEWCNEGVEAQIEELQNIRYSDVPSWRTIFLSNGYIAIEDIRELPQDIVKA